MRPAVTSLPLGPRSFLPVDSDASVMSPEPGVVHVVDLSDPLLDSNSVALVFELVCMNKKKEKEKKKKKKKCRRTIGVRFVSERKETRKHPWKH